MRLNEETEFKPKPMVNIGNVPILVHIMNIYAYYGHKDFVLCLGYKGDVIKDYFLTLSRHSDDFKFNMKTGNAIALNKKQSYDYNITFVETGLETLSSGRVLRAMKYIKDDHFMVTYGDGVSTIDINKLIDFHMKQEKELDTFATVSCVHPHSKYGRIAFNDKNLVTTFEEKKKVLDDYINGGFQVYNRRALDYFKDEDEVADSLTRMTEDKKLSMYKHNGFWHCLDTMKDYQTLNSLWDDGRPWAVWEKD